MHQFRFLIGPALLAIVLLFAALVAQMDGGRISPELQTYRGYYFEGLETSNFYPCDYEEMWRIEPSVPYLSREYRRITNVQSVSVDNIAPIYVELSGRVSELGKYGHLGLANRELSVMETIATDRIYKSDRQCKPATEHWPIVVFEYE